MKENKYDSDSFFDKYSQMDRSVKGLAGAGEWHELKKALPDFAGKSVLDLGCGFGWHCRYAAENGAKSVTGVDISQKMLEKAEEINGLPIIKYICTPIEDFAYPQDVFNIVISSLAIHYLADFAALTKKIRRTLSTGGAFVFSVEHPTFTAYGPQKWHCENGKRLHWPVDRYFDEGPRSAEFLGENVTKYHRTLATYIETLLENGFEITKVSEPSPTPEAIENVPEMKDETRRPIFLIVAARKK